MSAFEALYFVAVLPSEDISKEVTAFKRYVEAHFGASHALKSPPHITLFPPFKRKETEEAPLISVLEAFAQEQCPFYLQFKGFNCFAPRVLFVDVVPNTMLKSMQKALEEHFEDILHLRSDRPHNFNPHLTIAHKDLSRTQFYPAWAHFSTQSYERACMIESIVLLKHNGRVWVPYREFGLGG